MAVMVPEVPAHDSSQAEIWLFRKLQGLSEKYCVLHSLGSMRHDHKSWSEIDFTIVGPEGVYFVEVKGGTVGREKGKWTVKRKDGRVENLGRGPFFQAGGAEASTRRFLQDRLPWLKNVVIGYWVITPDCTLEVDDLGVDRNAFYDAKNLDVSPTDLVRNMRAYWKQKRGTDASLTDEQINEVVKNLCADVPMITSLRREIDDVLYKIHAATLAQEQVLVATKSNARLLIRGPAGSGKSTIAVLEVRNQRREGAKVLFSCSSPNMSKRIAGEFLDDKGVRVASSADLAAGSDFQGEMWDALVIDEAQDLFEDPMFEIYDSLLKNGIAGGTWRMFSDPYQAVLSKGRPLEKKFLELGNPFRLDLMQNVRTTREISVTASALGYVDRMTAGISGPEVDLLYCSPAKVGEQIATKVGALISLGLKASEILLLGFDQEDAVQYPELKNLIEPLETSNYGGAVRFASISEVKGLEAVAVIVFGFKGFKSGFARQQAYIGATRASTYLSIILGESLSSQVADAYAALALRNPAR